MSDLSPNSDGLAAKNLQLPQNLFSMLCLRELHTMKRQHFQRNVAWVHRYELKSVLSGHRGCVNTIHWSPGSAGDVLVSGSDDMTVKLWRPGAMNPVASLATAHRHNIFDAHLTGQEIISCGADGFVCKTSLDGWQETLFAPNLSHMPLAFKMDFLPGTGGQVFLVTFGDGDLRHFDLRAAGHTVAVNCDEVGLVGLGVDPRDGRTLALGGNDPFLRIYDLRTLSFHSEGSLNMITTPVVSLHSTEAMLRKHKKTISFSRFFSGHSDVCISGVCWDTCGRLLANYRGGDIELFDFQNKPLHADEDDLFASPAVDVYDSSLPSSRVYLNSIRSFQGRINEQTCAKEVRFLCHGAAVASGGDCGHFYIWSTASGDLLRKLPADRCVVNSVAPHPQLPLVATSGIDADIKTWDVDQVVERFSKGTTSVSLSEASEMVEEGHALIRQGAWLEAIGFYEAAVKVLRQSAGQEEQLQTCWLKCAFCHFNLEEYEQTIQCCSHALEAGATSSPALLRRAAAQLALERPDAAEADLEEAEDLEPENAEIPKLRSKLRKLKKRLSKESKSKGSVD